MIRFQTRPRRSALCRSTAVVALAASVLVESADASTGAETPTEYVSLGDSYAAVGSLPATSADTCQANDNVGHMVARRLAVSFTDLSCRGVDTATVMTTARRLDRHGTLGPTTRLVTVSVGGNDGNLFNDLTPCLWAVTCTSAVRASLAGRVDSLPPNLDHAYSDIRAAAPNARVVVVGYLAILPDSARGCFLESTAGEATVVFVATLMRKLSG